GMALNGALLKRKLVGMPGGEELIPLVDSLAQETARLAHLVSDYLAYTQTKRIELNLETVDLERLARQVVDEQQAIFEAANVVVDVERACPVPHARLDAAKLRQVLHNLL